MNNMIMGLLYIEENAALNDLALEGEAAGLARRIEEAGASVAASIVAETERRILAMKKRLARETAEKIAAIDALAYRRARYIEKQFTECGGRWEDEIYGSVLGN